MNGATQPAPAAAPWRHRMAPGTAPAPIYADDPPLFDGWRAAPPVATADSAALAALHAPASIARRRAATARQDRPASGPPAEPDRTTGVAGTGDRNGKEQKEARGTAGKGDYAAHGRGTDRCTAPRRRAQGPPYRSLQGQHEGRWWTHPGAAQPLQAGERQQVPPPLTHDAADSASVAHHHRRRMPDRTTGAAGTGESMGDFMQRAQEALSIEAERWAPQVGEVMSGRLIRCRAIEGQYDKPFRVLTLVPFGGGPAIDVSEKQR